jgi:hypothetical protein
MIEYGGREGTGDVTDTAILVRHNVANILADG